MKVIFLLLSTGFIKGMISDDVIIYPGRSATVLENEQLNITCSFPMVNDECLKVCDWFLGTSAYISTIIKKDKCTCTNTCYSSTMNYDCKISNNRCLYTIITKNLTKDRHGDIFKCQVGKISSNTTINVIVPKVEISPDSSPDSHLHEVDLYEGQQFTFTCKTSAWQSEATIKWFKRDNKNTTIDIQSRISNATTWSGTLQLTTSKLLFVPNRSDHNLTIYCQAFDGERYKVTSSMVRMNVSFPARSFRILNYENSSSLEILERNKYNLTCLAEDANTLVNLTWTCFDGIVNSSSRTHTVDSTVSWIANRNQTEQTCTCSSSYSVQTWNQFVYVKTKVLYGASISNFTINGRSRDFEFNEGTTLSLNCRVDSNPGSTLRLKAPNGTVYKKGNTLEASYTLTNASCFNSGNYSCSAFNQHNNGTKSLSVHYVTIKSNPTVVNSENSGTFYKRIFDNVTFGLNICAFPTPNMIKWFKLHDNNKTELTKGISSNNQHYCLTIESIQEADFGEYELIVDNGQGKPLEHKFYLNAYGLPEVPSGLVYDNRSVSHDSVVIQWRGGFNGGSEQSFFLQYRPESTSTWQTLVLNDTGNVLRTTLTGLSENTMFKVRVFAGNSEGNSSATSIMEFSTLVPPKSQSSSLTLLVVVVGSATGGVSIGFVLLYKKYKHTDGKGTNADKTNKTRNQSRIRHQPQDNNDDDAMVENEFYVSAGPYLREGASQSGVHATENRPDVANDAYIYAQVKKEIPEESVYQNCSVRSAEGRSTENTKRARNASPAKSQRHVNQDGLVYVDVVFNDYKKGEKGNIIHGNDQKTEYITVDFRKRAQPLPDSDEEAM